MDASTAAKDTAAADSTTHTTLDFLHAIFDGMDGFIEFRLIGGGRQSQHFVPLADLWGQWPDWQARLAKANANGANIYFGACPRVPRWAALYTTGSGEHKQVACATKEVAATYLAALQQQNFKDARISDTPIVLGQGPNVEWCSALRVDVDSLDPAILRPNYAPVKAITPANIIVRTGHGYHWWWLLREPITPAEAEPIMAHLARVMGGDGVMDAPRIMRLPGFDNMKAAPVPCYIHTWAP